MRIEIEVKKAEVLLRDGTDLVSLVTDKPYPFPYIAELFKRDPALSLRMQFEVVRNCGIEYCQENFGIFPDIINTRG